MLSKREMAQLGRSGQELPDPDKKLGDRIHQHLEDLNAEVDQERLIDPREFNKDPGKYITRVPNAKSTNLMDLIETNRQNKLNAQYSPKIDKDPKPKAEPKNDGPQRARRPVRESRGRRRKNMRREQQATPEPQPKKVLPEPKPIKTPAEVIRSATKELPTQPTSAPETTMLDPMDTDLDANSDFDDAFGFDDNFGVDPDEEMGMDATLAALQERIDEAPAAPAKEEEPKPRQMTAEEWIMARAYEILIRQGVKDPAAGIGRLKEKYGKNLHMTLIGERVLIYTPLPRSQWRRIQSMQRTLAQKGSDDGALQEAMLRAVILGALKFPKFRSPDAQESFFLTCEAGLPDSLYIAIQQASGFYTPQEIMNRTVRL